MATNPTTAMAPSTSSDKYFLWFSDVHYDPYYSTTDAFKAGYNKKAVCNSTSIPSLGSVGCDSPKALVDSALAYATKIDASPSFIVLSGDLIRHGVDMLYTPSNHEGSENRVGDEVEIAAHAEYHTDAMNEAGKIINDLVTIFTDAFPGVEVIISIGNNDVVPDYYLQLQGDMSNSSKLMTPEDSGMLGIIYNALSENNQEESTTYNQVGAQRRGRNLLSVGDSATFLKGGYYSRVLPDGLTVLSINTVLYSSYFGPEPLNVEDPGEQFTWMRNALMDIRERGNSQAMIVGHIPPSMGSFRHTQLWQEKYINVYYDIITEFDNVIIGQLFGHLHSDEFRVGAGTTGIPSSLSSPLLLGGSLTPIHGNNPSFRKVFYEGGADDENQYKLLDYESHRLSISDSTASWSQLYTFSETYGTFTKEIKTEGLSGNVFRSLLRSMEEKHGNISSALNSFLSLEDSGSAGDTEVSHSEVDCDADCQAEWLCTLSGTTTTKQYIKCLQQKRGSSRHIIGIAGAAMFAAVFLFVMIVRAKRSRARDQYESASSVDGASEIEGTVEIEDSEMI